VNRAPSLIRSVCALVAALAAAGPAWAQRADGPNAGLFGGQGDRAESLDFHGSVFGANDDVIVPATATALDPRFQQNTTVEGFGSDLTYNRRTDVFNFAATGGTSMRRYARSDEPLATTYNASSGLSGGLGRKWGYNASASFTDYPFYQFAPFLSANVGSNGPLTPGFGAAASGQRNQVFNSTAGLVANYSKTSSIAVSGSYRDWRFPGLTGSNLKSWGGLATYRRRLSRKAGLHLGYGRDQASAPGVTGGFTTQTIDVGIDYGDTLKFSRRTAFSFSTSTAAIRFANVTHYRLNGSANLTSGFLRSWSTWLAYSRATEYIAGFGQPVLSDWVTTGVGGLFTHRLKGSAAVGLSRGQLGFTADTFYVLSATPRIDMAVSRTLGIYAQYGYYHYTVPPHASELNLVPQLSRQAITAGLSVWVPLLNTKRAPRDPR
jgi:hypothetical protein